METDERMEFDREIHSIATRMLDLVNKSLSSSRARLVSVVSNVDAVIPFRHILHTQASVAREKGVLFDGVVHQEPLIVQADDQDLVTIFENLIGNAVKFTPKNGHVQAAIRATGNPTEPPRMLFSVSDSGPGLTLADQVKLFQPFSRLSARPTGTEVSTGLGLHLVKRTVEQLQGRVWCESEPGHGATFFVELPLAQEGG
jgi:signal transduction histidine kinase